VDDAVNQTLTRRNIAFIVMLTYLPVSCLGRNLKYCLAQIIGFTCGLYTSFLLLVPY